MVNVCGWIYKKSQVFFVVSSFFLLLFLFFLSSFSSLLPSGKKSDSLSLFLFPLSLPPYIIVPAEGITLPLKSGSDAKLKVPGPLASNSTKTISLFPVFSTGPGTYCLVCGPFEGQ